MVHDSLCATYGLQTCSIEPIDADGYDTVVRGHSFHLWALAAHDPGAQTVRWTFEGAPANLEAPITCLYGVFPGTSDDVAKDRSCLDMTIAEVEGFDNYSGVEDDPDVCGKIDESIQHG